jgi:predicted nucleic acid-binding protein
MLVVSDASPLICLSDAGCLDLLRLAYGEVVIPEEVHEEVYRSGHARAKPSWVKIRSLTDARGIATFAALRKTLDRGESAAIALAITCHATVLIDEALGAEECARRGIQAVNTAQVVATLRADGKISAKRAESVASVLRRHGVFA